MGVSFVLLFSQSRWMLSTTRLGFLAFARCRFFFLRVHAVSPTERLCLMWRGRVAVSLVLSVFVEGWGFCWTEGFTVMRRTSRVLLRALTTSPCLVAVSITFVCGPVCFRSRPLPHA